MAYRLPTTVLELPNNSNDIRVPLNTVASNVEFNNIIGKLGDNFTYLLESSVVVDNRSPISNDWIYDFDAGNRVATSVGHTAPAHNYVSIKAIDKINGEILFVASTTTVIDFWVFNETGNTLTKIKSYTRFNDKSNQNFQNIEFIELYNNNLYVYDSYYSIMVVYNISAFVNEDDAIDDIKYITQFYHLEDLVAITVTPTSVFGITATELIRYNKDFNVIATTTLNEPNPTDIIAIGNNPLYVLNDTTISRYNLNLTYQNQVSFTLSVSLDDTFFRLEESQVDEDVVYLLGSSFIVKVDLENQSEIGYFKMPNSPTPAYVDFHIKVSGDKDDVYILDPNRVVNATDKLQFVNIYDVANMGNEVDISDLQINDLEMEQDYVFNAVLQKLSFNTLLMYNSIVYKAVVTTEENGFIEYSHVLNQANPKSFTDVSIYMGQNEVFSYQLFQKSFEKILEIQNKCIELLNFDYLESDTNTLII